MWKKVAKFSEIQEGKSIVVEVDNKPIAIFNVAGKFYALDNVCPHRGGPLGEGYLEGLEVTCPWHAWSFNVTTGDCESQPGFKQPTYRVKIEGDDITVEV